MLRTIGAHLANDGHDVHVFATVPSYRSDGSTDTVSKRQTIDGLHIRRMFAFQEKNRLFIFRLINVLLYCVGLFARIITLRPDVVTVSTFPPVIAAWTTSLAAKLVGAKLIYHCQDIHPEVSKYSGGRLGRGGIFKLLCWLDNQTLRRAAAIIVLSQDMRNTLTLRGLGTLPVHVINNFLLDDFSNTDMDVSAWMKGPDRTRIIFAGNLGKFQNLHLLSDGIAPCLNANPSLELFFLGSGSEEAKLKKRWAHTSQVKFAPFMPFAAAKTLIADADIGIVSLAPNIYHVSYPSKVLSYLGLGLPLLVLVEPESQLASEIQSAGIGMVPASLTPSDIAKTVTALSTLQKDTTAWYNENASIEVVLDKWRHILGGLTH